MFTQPEWLLLILFVPVVWLKRRASAIKHPNLGIHRRVGTPFWAHIPNLALSFSLVSLSLAIARPVLFEAAEVEVIESRDFVIAIDISSSMNEKIGGQTTSPTGAVVESRKIDAARDAARLFTSRREGDRVGLLLFDDRAYYSWPLSTDLEIIDRKTSRIGTANGGGTDFDGEDGALQASIDHLVELGQSRSRVIILVSDGEDSISDERFQSLRAQIVEQGIKLYILGVGKGWVSGSSSTSDLREFVSAVGGTVIVVADEGEMRAGFEQIDSLEKSSVEIKSSIHHVDIYHYFVWAGLALLLVYLIVAGLIGQQG